MFQEKISPWSALLFFLYLDHSQSLSSRLCLFSKSFLLVIRLYQCKVGEKNIDSSFLFCCFFIDRLAQNVHKYGVTVPVRLEWTRLLPSNVVGVDYYSLFDPFGLSTLETYSAIFTNC
jgi:hypothetical protein